jgi:hypothetical protein
MVTALPGLHALSCDKLAAFTKVWIANGFASDALAALRTDASFVAAELTDSLTLLVVVAPTTWTVVVVLAPENVAINLTAWLDAPVCV